MAKKRNPRPNIFHPNYPGAVGSCVSPLQAGRDMDREFERTMDDSAEKIQRKPHKLPKEALRKIDEDKNRS